VKKNFRSGPTHAGPSSSSSWAIGRQQGVVGERAEKLRRHDGVETSASSYRFPASGVSVSGHKLRLIASRFYTMSYLWGGRKVLHRCSPDLPVLWSNGGPCAPSEPAHRFPRAWPQPGRGKAPCAPFAYLGGGRRRMPTVTASRAPPARSRGRRSRSDRAGCGARAAPRWASAAPILLLQGFFSPAELEPSRRTGSRRGARCGAACDAR